MGSGVPNQETNFDLEPLSGSFKATLTFSQHMDFTRTQWNTVRSDAINAGGMGNITAAYSAIRGALDAIESGRDDWLDAMTTGADGTETALLRKGVVWRFTMCEIPTVPQP